MKKCPDCAQFIQADARTCPFCKKDLAVMVSSTSEFTPDALSKKCPDCAETIKLEALVCRFCGHKFESTEVQAAIQKAQSEFQAELKNAKEKENAKRAAVECPKCNSTNTAWEGWWGGRACRGCGHKWAPGMF